MARLKNIDNRRLQTWIQLLLFIGLLLLINILANARIGGRPLYTSIDLTEENRYTLTNPTVKLLEDIDEVVYIRILLDGEFPAGFRRLQNATQDLLDDFRSVSGYVEYEFDNPSDGTTEEINQRREKLAKDGITPVNLRVKSTEGTEQKLIYPYAIVYYKGRSRSISLLENEVPGIPPQVALNNSIGLLEYKFANVIQKMRTVRQPYVLFTEGHGELTPIELGDLSKTLRPFYELGRINLDSVVQIGKEASLLFVCKPTQPFSEQDKFKIDQYVMNGGKVIWLLDRVRADLDSLRGRERYYPNEYDLNLDDLLFRYGIRIQPNLVLDYQCSPIPLATGVVGNAPQFDNFKYPYHPVILPGAGHPVVKGIGPVNLKYPSTIDLNVMTKTEVEKTPLLQSSENSRTQFIPVELDFDFLRYELQPEKFDQGPQTVGLLLEGTFPSLYENRLTESMRSGLEEIGLEFKATSQPTQMAVVSDGDIARNRVGNDGRSFSPLGYNEFDKYLYANKDFLVNLVEFMMDENGVIESRAKEVKLRMLDTAQAKAQETYWQLLNIGLPLLFLLLFGLGYNWWRKRKYATI